MPTTPTPDSAGWVAAQQRLRASFGSTVWFLPPASVTFPPNTVIDPNTNLPVDPAIRPLAGSSVASASANCDVFFRAISRGGLAREYDQTAADIRNTSLVMLILDYSDRAIAQAATTAQMRGDTWKIMAQKPDGVFSGTERWLVYLKEI